MSTDCYTDSNGCIVCPELPATPAIPPSSSSATVLGWNASADSSIALNGDLHVVFTVAMQPVGTLCGFRSPLSAAPTAPSLFTHAIMAFANGANMLYDVYENGGRIQLDWAGAIGDTLEIRRTGESVTYFVTPSGGVQQRMYTSAQRSTGPLIVSGCLYASGDQIG